MSYQAAITAVSGGLLIWWLLRPPAEDEMKDEFVIPEGKKLFEPTFEWQQVEDFHVCPAGLEFRLDLSSGRNLARIPPPT